MTTIDAASAKSCCAALYQTDWVRLLLGESFHPGGLALTSRLSSLLDLDANSVVLDVACGRGTSALHLARTFGCHVIGLDLGVENVGAARQAAEQSGLDTLAEFRVGDGEAIPLAAASVDVVICECAFCTFPDKARAAAEFARVLRPGGRVGLSDLTRFEQLPPELEGLLAWVACIADARCVEEYAGYLQNAGFGTASIENHDDALREMVRDIRQRLLAVELLTKIGSIELPFVDVEQANSMAKVAAEAVRNGQLGYSLVMATK
jgi:ubiquinone/menaquinone biosynthesis C-methylase UbiE